MNKKQRKSKLIFELKRKSIHILASIYILIYWISFSWFGHQIAMLILLSTLILFIVIDFFRIREHRKIPIIHLLWRKTENNCLGGQVYFMLGVIIAFGLFEFKIAVAAILMTTIGDMAAAIFGVAFGKHKISKNSKKSWEGTSAEFVVDLIIAFLILQNPLVAIAMALTATVVETTFSHIDDNLAIPVFSGFIAQCLKLVFP
jgi:dolichol kinase